MIFKNNLLERWAGWSEGKLWLALAEITLRVGHDHPRLSPPFCLAHCVLYPRRH